ncbi:hypothetical protein HRR88_001032 [Exophiala dermatitidis]|nr:hypothetical protein HRR88_001032 [Exophiala dermatitidis]KAJ4639597.1 hypothetical protein HRR89_004915 [Exophiala dermatitidis]KAJ4654527.1 hypothetical protein HRR91_004019 [Exophiala dermatitidis]KAJ4676754.1 hypothetical protein HRR95_004870 [Exophiala dermatitidis]
MTHPFRVSSFALTTFAQSQSAPTGPEQDRSTPPLNPGGPEQPASPSNPDAAGPNDAATKFAEAIDDFLGDLEKKFKGISDEILTKREFAFPGRGAANRHLKQKDELLADMDMAYWQSTIWQSDATG